MLLVNAGVFRHHICINQAPKQHLLSHLQTMCYQSYRLPPPFILFSIFSDTDISCCHVLRHDAVEMRRQVASAASSTVSFSSTRDARTIAGVTGSPGASVHIHTYSVRCFIESRAPNACIIWPSNYWNIYFHWLWQYPAQDISKCKLTYLAISPNQQDVFFFVLCLLSGLGMQCMKISDTRRMSSLDSFFCQKLLKS